MQTKGKRYFLFMSDDYCPEFQAVYLGDEYD